MVRTALTVAGSDSGGGAGIQADLKTFAALGVHGTCAIAALTAQNSVGVAEVFDLPAAFVAAQFDAVASDIGIDALKTGMLFSAEIVRSVAGKIREWDVSKVVVDPVMLASSGDPLLRLEAVEALKGTLLPLALVATPNLAEAGALAGMEVLGEGDVLEAARRILAMGPRFVLVKGGHARGDPVDWLCDAKGAIPFRAPRVSTANTHGTGCTLSAAIAACLALGRAVPEAVAAAKEFVSAALRHSYPLGRGPGPLNPMFALHPELS